MTEEILKKANELHSNIESLQQTITFVEDSLHKTKPKIRFIAIHTETGYINIKDGHFKLEFHLNILNDKLSKLKKQFDEL